MITKFLGMGLGMDFDVSFFLTLKKDTFTAIRCINP